MPNWHGQRLRVDYLQENIFRRHDFLLVSSRYVTDNGRILRYERKNASLFSHYTRKKHFLRADPDAALRPRLCDREGRVAGSNPGNLLIFLSLRPTRRNLALNHQIAEPALCLTGCQSRNDR